jgi:hypothetical protein
MDSWLCARRVEPRRPGQQLVAPGEDPSYGGQATHALGDAEPLKELYLPAGHGWQATEASEAPIVGLKVPEGQG